MDEITLKALAKINLGLDVVRRREDGYHEVRMIMQTIHLYDLLEIQKIREPGIQIVSNLSFLPVNENNLVYKAARLLQEEFALTDGISVKLTKRIPVAAGMAGGSTDAAAMLYAMNQLYDLGLSRRELMKRGVQIGADVPYCLMRGTALAEGIGEKLTQLPPMIKCPVLIAKPSISVSTRFFEHPRLIIFTFFISSKISKNTQRRSSVTEVFNFGEGKGKKISYLCAISQMNEYDANITMASNFCQRSKGTRLGCSGCHPVLRRCLCRPSFFRRSCRRKITGISGTESRFGASTQLAG